MPCNTVQMQAMGFPGDSVGEESACNARDLGSIPGLGRSPGEGNGYPLQYYGLENSMDHTAHGVARSWTRLSDFHWRREWQSPPVFLPGGFHAQRSLLTYSRWGRRELDRTEQLSQHMPDRIQNRLHKPGNLILSTV